MFTAAQTQKLFKAVKGNPRDYAMVLLADAVGMTPEQISSALLSDFDPGTVQGTILLRRTADDGTEVSEAVPLPMSVRNPLKAFAGGRTGGKGAPLFPTEGKRASGRPLEPKEVRRIIKDALDAIGGTEAAPAPVTETVQPKKIEMSPPAVKKKGQNSLDDFLRIDGAKEPCSQITNS